MRNLRIMSVDNFIIFYIIDKNLKQVNIVNIFYGKRNIEDILKQIKSPCRPMHRTAGGKLFY